MEGRGGLKQFALKIVTPDGLRYEGPAEEVTVRTTTGDLGIMAGHISCVAPLGMGQTTLLLDGQRRYGACIGGMVSVMNNVVTIVATTFEWADQIDQDRAKRSEELARSLIQDKSTDSAQLRLAEARLKRALIRQNVAGRKGR